MAIFASLNPHISGGSQPPRTKLSTLVEAPVLHFWPEARWDRSNHFRAIDDEVQGKCAKIGTHGEFGAP